MCQKSSISPRYMTRQTPGPVNNPSILTIESRSRWVWKTLEIVLMIRKSNIYNIRPLVAVWERSFQFLFKLTSTLIIWAFSSHPPVQTRRHLADERPPPIKSGAMATWVGATSANAWVYSVCSVSWAEQRTRSQILPATNIPHPDQSKMPQCLNEAVNSEI